MSALLLNKRGSRSAVADSDNNNETDDLRIYRAPNLGAGGKLCKVVISGGDVGTHWLFGLIVEYLGVVSKYDEYTQTSDPEGSLFSEQTHNVDGIANEEN